MKTYITVNGVKVKLRLQQYAVRLFNDNNEVTFLLNSHAKAATAELVSQIKSAYKTAFNQPLHISDASMEVEIWGHVYIEKFAAALKRILPFKPMDKLFDKIIFHCREIDMGERGHDSNRIVWDMLAPLKPVIAGLLFYRQRSTK